MSEYKVRQPLPTLSYENSRTWFPSAKNYLIGEGTWWVISEANKYNNYTLPDDQHLVQLRAPKPQGAEGLGYFPQSQYQQVPQEPPPPPPHPKRYIRVPANLTKVQIAGNKDAKARGDTLPFEEFQFIEEEEIVARPATSSAGSQSGGSMKSLEEWRVANSKALYQVNLCLSEDDKIQYCIYTKAIDLWQTLLQKYMEVMTADVTSFIQEFVNFKMDEDDTIDGAWAHLATLGSRIAAVSPDDSHYMQTGQRMRYLLSALPPDYSSMKGAIQAQPYLQPEHILRMLKGREADMRINETAMAAQTQRNKTGKKISCYICEGPHIVTECKYLPAVKESVKKGTIKDKSTGSSREPTNRLHQKTKAKGVQLPPSPSSSGTLTPEDILKALTQTIATLSAKQTTKRPARAYAAQSESDSEKKSESSPEPSDDEIYDEVAHASIDAKGELPLQQWLLDSCSSSHMTDQISLFRGPLKLLPLKKLIKVGGGILSASHEGDAVMEDRKGNKVILKRVLFVPGLGVNLVSWNKLSSQFDIQPPDFNVVSSSDGKPVLQTIIRRGVPIITTIKGMQEKVKRKNQELEWSFPSAESEPIPFDESEELAPSLTRKKAQWELWHRRFAHYGAKSLRNVHKVTTLDKPIPTFESRDCPCRVCLTTKMKRSYGGTTEQKQSIMELISVDICGPLPVSRKGFKWFLQIVDNASRMKWTRPMKDKSDAPQELKQWKVSAETETGKRLKAIRIDNAGELVKLAKEWEKEEGIHPEFTDAYSSNQNGIAERNIQTSENNVRAMCEDSGMPIVFWPEALDTHTYLSNVLANGPEVEGFRLSPVEAWTGRKPAIDHLRVWGCQAIVYVPREELAGAMHNSTKSRADKFMNTGKPVVFMGYVKGTGKMWKFWDPDFKDIKTHSTVRFLEDKKGGDLELNLGTTGQSNSASLNRNPRGRPKRLPLVSGAVETPDLARQLIPKFPIFRRIVPEDTSMGETGSPDKERGAVPSPPPEAEPVVHIPPASTPAPVPEPVWRKRLRSDSISPDDRPSKRHEYAMFAQIMIMANELAADGIDFLEEIDEAAFIACKETVGAKHNVPIPKTYKEAINDVKWGHLWKEAIQKELTALESNHTWSQVVPPKGANLVTSKWVFDVKHLISGAIEKFKARLVARGFSQKLGVDFTDTFAPTVRHDTLRCFMATVAKKNLHMHVVDVNNAFTESFLKEDIFMSPPPGVDIPPGKVFKILKSLYGLKQAARDWNQLCVQKLKKLGFTQSEVDPCLLVHDRKGIMILTWVDDIPIASSSLDNINWFKEEFGKVFKIKDLGEPDKIVGIKITRDRIKGTLKLDQGHYIRESLSKFGMSAEKGKPTLSPMDSYDDLRKAGPSDPRVDSGSYQEQTGTWMWPMVMCRPDLAFAIGRLSSFASDPTVFHEKAIKKVARYLRSFPDLGLEYSREGHTGLVGYSDADYAMDKADRVSILGWVFFLAGAPVAWSSKKMKSVATSTMEAEYMAMSNCGKQAQFLSSLLREMGHPDMVGQNPFEPVMVLKGDNQACLHLVKDSHSHERSKHIDIAYNNVRKMWEENQLTVEFCPTADMVADGLTKPKSGQQFQNFLGQLGMM